MKNILKKFIPSGLLKKLRPIYHGALAFFAHWYFGKPSDKLIVIGVTGTNGKSTTVNLIAKILQEAGLRCGFTSTVNFGLPSGEKMNDIKMTMPSGFVLHKWMSNMVLAGYKAVVLEISSEGLAQNRHLGINFDIAVFTNLTPEHLESHGGFENYKKAKGKLFESITKQKKLGIQKTIVVNADDLYQEFFTSFRADKYVSFGVKKTSDWQASGIVYGAGGVSYKIKNEQIALHLKGQFDVYNSLAAIATASALGIELRVSKSALEKIQVIPGRVEVLQEQPFYVVVDYAYEPEEMRQLYETLDRWPHKKILQVLGACGGGRDHERIKILGEMAGKKAGMVFVTTDDPYDDDPYELSKPMIAAAKLGQAEVFLELDRKKAIALALKKAQNGDLVLVTGKGADQKMALANGRYLDWDDREVIKALLNNKELNV